MAITRFRSRGVYVTKRAVSNDVPGFRELNTFNCGGMARTYQR